MYLSMYAYRSLNIYELYECTRASMYVCMYVREGKVCLKTGHEGPQAE